MLSWLWLVLALLFPVACVSESKTKALWVVNMTSIPANLVPLFQTVQGVVSREVDSMAILLAGLKTDTFKISGSDMTAESLAFIREHYNDQLEYSADRFISDPWEVFQKIPDVTAAVTHLVLCSTSDAPHALYAALTLASLHGKSAAVCVDPNHQAGILERSGLALLRNISGKWPAKLSNGSSANAHACASVNLFVENETAMATSSSSTWSGNSSVLSTKYFGTWGSGPTFGKPTQGFDFVTKERMLVMCLDSQSTDWPTTQTRLLRRYTPLSIGFGWWTTEAKDIWALSSLGITFLGGGHNAAVYSALPPLTGTPQPSATAPLPDLREIPPNASLVVFSFSQGDSVAFNQKFNPGILETRSAVEPTKRIAERYPFSLMETPLDALIQPNVASQIAALQGTRQFLTGKPYGYASPTALDAAGHLGAYLSQSRRVLPLIGFPDVMVTESASATLNMTMMRMALLAPWLRSIIIKHPLAYPADPSKAGTEPARIVGGNQTLSDQSGSVILVSDPVHALSDAKTNDIDVNATIAATLASAKVRRFFYVFLDHQMTAGPLEEVLDTLTREHSEEVYLVNFDTAYRLCERDPEVRRCFETHPTT